MKYIDEYRDGKLAQNIIEKISSSVTRPWVIMEVCGGQTHCIIKYGLDQMLPNEVELIHGPGCPVCVTPLEMIDKAHAIAAQKDVIFCSFGDMMRIPGSQTDLFQVKASGGDVRVVYSPLDAVRIARENPNQRVVFFGIGFETTVPANAMAIWQARKEGLKNFSMLVSQVLVPPAVDLILSSPKNRVQGLLAAGHVCTVVGYKEYERIAADYSIPIVPTGFEPLDILEGIWRVVRQLERGSAEVENQYTRTVTRDGNTHAWEMALDVFEVCDRQWRGIGEIPQSGLKLNDAFKVFDAELIFATENIQVQESSICISGDILKGLSKPSDCSAFGVQCTPETPLGTTMVSAEGTCAAFYKYGRHQSGCSKTSEAATSNG
jgi:hydrogenase expression/formation protein HypD